MAVPNSEDEPDTREDDAIVDKNGIKENAKKDEEAKERKPSRFESICYILNINPNLVMLKITLFTIYGASASLLPYLTLHMQSIGLTVEEMSVIYLALPLTTFLSAPVTGFLLDKLGYYKLVVILTLVLNALFHHSLLLIPPMESPGKIPAAYVMRDPNDGLVDFITGLMQNKRSLTGFLVARRKQAEILHKQTEQTVQQMIITLGTILFYRVWWSPCTTRECPDDDSTVDLILDDCFDHCKLWNASTPVVALTEYHNGMAVRPDAEKSQHPLKEEDIPGPGGFNDDLHFRPEKKKSKNGTSLSKSTKHHHSVSVTTTAPPQTARNEPAFMVVELHDNPKDPPNHLGMAVEQDDEDTDFRNHFSRELLESRGVNFTALLDEDLRCGGTVRATNLTSSKIKFLVKDCMLQRCSFRKGGPQQCPPNYREMDDRTFWLYFLLRFLGTVMMSGGVTMMDPIALSLIQEHGGQFGRERLFSSIGMALFSPLTGLLMDHYSQHAGYSDYSTAFYMYDVLHLISVVTLLLMPVVPTSPSDHIITDLNALFKMPNVIAFIFFLFALGNFWGFIESYLFLVLKELGARNTLLGVTVTVGTVSSIPFLWGAEGITRRFGHVNVIVIAFFSQAVRLMGYSFIESPWWCFPFEAMESLALHLMWVAAATYCTILAPRSLLATLIGVLGTAHFSIGRGAGSFFGGLILSVVGTRRAFRIMGLVSIACGICYYLLNKLWLEREELEDDEDVDDEDPEPGQDSREANRASLERLSFMIQFNQKGSLSSLNRGSRNDLRRPDNMRQNSVSSVRSSTSRMDLRRSTLEMNLQHFVRGSTPALNTTPGTVAAKAALPLMPREQRNLSFGSLNPRGSSRVSIREEVEEHPDESAKKIGEIP